MPLTATVTVPAYSQKPDTYSSALPLCHTTPSHSLSTAAYKSTWKESKEKVTALLLFFPFSFEPLPVTPHPKSTLDLKFIQTWVNSRHLEYST